MEENKQTLDNEIEERDATLDNAAEQRDAAPVNVVEERDATPDSGIEERDATLEDEPGPIPAMTADELQDSLLEDSDMTAFQKYCARMDDKRWARTQRIAGAIMGVIAGVALFWESLTGTEETARRSFLSLPLVIAIVIALAVPNIIEKKSLRTVPKLRIAMIIALAAVIVVYFLFVGVQTGFNFSA